VLEEELVQGGDADEDLRIDVRRNFERRGSGRADANPSFTPERIQLSNVRVDVQRGIGHSRHEQCGVSEIRIGAASERRELANESV